VHFELHIFTFSVDPSFRSLLSLTAGTPFHRYLPFIEKVVLVMLNLYISTEHDQRAKYFESELFDLDF